MTNEPIVGAPGPGRSPKESPFTSLVEAAGNHLGEWVSIPVPERLSTTEVHTGVRNEIARQVATVSVRNGRVYLVLSI